MLIVEQGSTIQSQRNLIKVLLRDSVELWAAKGKALGDQQLAQAQAKAKTHGQASSTQAPSAQTPSSQAPANQAPANQAPAKHAPSTQAVPQHRSHNHSGKVAKPDAQLPPVPASDLVDRRRSLSTI